MAAIEPIRPLAYFPPAVWSYEDFASLSVDKSELESYSKRVEELKILVKEMLLDSFVNDCDLVEKVKLIDLLRRLGISYHFEIEINHLLNQIFIHNPHLADGKDLDLCTAAIVFRVFRQHGYRISCDVFKRFMDKDGKFKESLANDAKGMLSLYEAGHLSLHGEDILDEALAYTRTNLLTMETTTQCSPNLTKQIVNAMQRPFFHGIARIETRRYIFFYEEEESCNQMLLKFAKVDFNRLQLLHQQELREVSRWYNDLEVTEKFPYVRHRIVEVYFWTIGAYFEPQYAKARIILTKIVTMMSLIDDTYDAYATLEELEPFTNAMKRWDMSAVDQLPSYMKYLYTLVLSLYDEIDEELKSEGRSFAIPYAKDVLKEMVRAYHVEAVWLNKGYKPSFDEYIEVGLVTSGYQAIPMSSFLGMGEIAGKNVFEWLTKVPKISRASQMICRLMDDIVSSKHEKKRGHVATAIECYMQQYAGISEEEVIKVFRKMVSDAWKDINEECMRPTAVSMDILNRFINLVSVVDFLHKYEDKYTFSARCKEDLRLLFIEKIPV